MEYLYGVCQFHALQLCKETDMNKKLFFPLTLLAATVMFASPVLAADENDGDGDLTIADNAQANAAMPRTTVPFISGGVGEDEMARIRSLQDQYDLKLLITEKNGVFLSDVHVSIEDRKGNTILETDTQGPVLLINLPDGKYTVKATRHDGETKITHVTVKQGKLHAYQVAFSSTDERVSGDAKTTPLK